MRKHFLVSKVAHKLPIMTCVALDIPSVGTDSGTDDSPYQMNQDSTVHAARWGLNSPVVMEAVQVSQSCLVLFE